MESKGANNPGILTLTTGLSKPFLRLEKYPTLLIEMERHMEVLNRSLSQNIHYHSKARGWFFRFFMIFKEVFNAHQGYSILIHFKM